MTKKSLSALISAAVSVSVVIIAFSACNAAEPFKPVVLKYADTTPQNSWFGQQHQWWADQVEKRTEGKIKIRMFWMESLVKWKDMLRGVQTGVADLGWVSSTYHPSDLPYLMVIDNPFNFREDYFAPMLALFDTMENESHLKAELERENLISITPHISGHLVIGMRTCPNSIQDLKAKSIRSYGGASIKYLEYLGLNPIFMSFSDIYEAVDRRTVDGADITMVLGDAFKLYEVIKCLYLTKSGGAISSGTYMNLDLFRKFPKDIQDMFMKLRHEYGMRYAEGMKGLESQFYSEWQTKHRVRLKEPTPEERKIILEGGRISQEEMIKKLEKDGHTGARAVWNYYMAALNKYEAQRAGKK